MIQPLTDPAGRGAVKGVLGSGSLLAFELDGTLAPTTRDRAGATLRPTTRDLLARLAAVQPCAVLSGRARQDVADRLRGVPVSEVIGNHGAEPLPPGTDELQVRRRIALWHAVLAPSLLEIPGLEIEDKRLSLTVHFRRARDRAEAERRIRLALRRATGARLLEGAWALDLVPEELPDQGSALKRLCLQLGVGSAILVGEGAGRDDVLRAEIPGLVAIQVGRAESRATYFLEDQAAVDDLLEHLLRWTARQAPARALAETAQG